MLDGIMFFFLFKTELAALLTQIGHDLYSRSSTNRNNVGRGSSLYLPLLKSAFPPLDGVFVGDVAPVAGSALCSTAKQV